MKAPKIGKVKYAGGSSSGGFLTNDNTLVLTGKGTPQSRITIFDNGKKIGTAKVDKKGKWSFDSKALGDGPHSFTAKAKLGKDASPVSKSLAGVIDATGPSAPSAPDLDPASDSGTSNADNITSDTTPTLTGTAEAGATVTIRDGATVLGTVTAHATTGAWSFTAAALSHGAHSLTATAADAAGNAGAASAALVVTIDTSSPAPSAPDLAAASDTGSSSTDNVTADTTPTLTGTAEAGATVTIRDGATVLGTAVANGAGQWSFTTAALTDAAHSLAATATDTAGNVSAASAALVLTVDTSADAPVITGFADDTGGVGDLVTLDTTPTLTGTAEAGASVEIFDDAASLGTATADENGDWSFTTGTLVDGHHVFTAQQTDAAGNAGAASSVFVLRVGYDIDVATMQANEGFRIFGAEVGDQAGRSVASAGDVNGDGFDDMIVGAVGGSGGLGVAYVVFGKAGGFGDIDLETLTAAGGFRITGAQSGDQAGWSVATAGDVNGDGFDDVLVGARFADPEGRQTAGESYLVFGKAGVVDVDLSSLTFTSSGAGFRIVGAEEYDEAGRSVSSAGDINGDGFDDMIVGAALVDDGIIDSVGASYVLFGKAGGFADVDLAALSPTDGFRILGAGADDRTGATVSSAGDVNGDGFDDLIVGAFLADGNADGRSDSGEAIVVFGKATGLADINLSVPLSSADGFRILGAEVNDRVGWSVSTAGDINGDGFDDMIVGMLGNYATYLGGAIVVFGRASGFGNPDAASPTFVTSGTGFRIFGEAHDQAGISVSSAGDFNGDGFDDLIVGAPYADAAGNLKFRAGDTYVLFGKAGGFADIDLADLTPAAGFRIFGADEEDRTGISVSSAGDINGDGFDDLIVGGYYGDGGIFGAPAEDNAGEAIVIFGGNLTGGVVFAGNGGPNTLTGTSDAETFVGGRGNDILTGGGGADAFQGGEGDDTFTVADLTFRKVDGGSGTDTLVFSGNAQTIDFTGFADNRVEGIEALDVTGSGADTIILGALDALHFSDTPHAGFTAAESHKNLVVDGDGDDTLDLRDLFPASGGDYTWVRDVASDGTTLDGSSGGGYNIYNLTRNSEVLASIAVDAAMDVLLTV